MEAPALLIILVMDHVHNIYAPRRSSRSFYDQIEIESGTSST